LQSKQVSTSLNRVETSFHFNFGRSPTWGAWWWTIEWWLNWCQSLSFSPSMGQNYHQSKGTVWDPKMTSHF
jgi:hypothetical protein